MSFHNIGTTGQRRRHNHQHSHRRHVDDDASEARVARGGEPLAGNAVGRSVGPTSSSAPGSGRPGELKEAMRRLLDVQREALRLLAMSKERAARRRRRAEEEEAVAAAAARAAAALLGATDRTSLLLDQFPGAAKRTADLHIVEEVVPQIPASVPPATASHEERRSASNDPHRGPIASRAALRGVDGVEFEAESDHAEDWRRQAVRERERDALRERQKQLARDWAAQQALAQQRAAQVRRGRVHNGTDANNGARRPHEANDLVESINVTTFDTEDRDTSTAFAHSRTTDPRPPPAPQQQPLPPPSHDSADALVSVLRRDSPAGANEHDASSRERTVSRRSTHGSSPAPMHASLADDRDGDGPHLRRSRGTQSSTSPSPVRTPPPVAHPKAPRYSDPTEAPKPPTDRPAPRSAPAAAAVAKAPPRRVAGRTAASSPSRGAASSPTIRPGSLSPRAQRQAEIHIARVRGAHAERTALPRSPRQAQLVQASVQPLRRAPPPVTKSIVSGR